MINQWNFGEFQLAPFSEVLQKSQNLFMWPSMSSIDAKHYMPCLLQKLIRLIKWNLWQSDNLTIIWFKSSLYRFSYFSVSPRFRSLFTRTALQSSPEDPELESLESLESLEVDIDLSMALVGGWSLRNILEIWVVVYLPLWNIYIYMYIIYIYIYI